MRRAPLESAVGDALDDVLGRERQDGLAERRRVCGKATADPRQRLRRGLAADDRDEDDVRSLEHREMDGLSGRVAQVGHDGKRELAEPARLLDGLAQLEEADAQIELVAVAIEEALPDEVGRDPRDRRLRQVRAPGQLRDAEPFVVFSERLEDGRDAIEHADRFGPVRGAHVATPP